MLELLYVLGRIGFDQPAEPRGGNTAPRGNAAETTRTPGPFVQDMDEADYLVPGVQCPQRGLKPRCVHSAV